jgi:hypothetical protein
MLGFLKRSSKIKVIIYRKTAGKYLKQVYDKVIKDTTIDFDFKEHTYAIDLSKVTKFDKEGNPILEYELDHVIPIETKDKTVPIDEIIQKQIQGDVDRVLQYELTTGENDSSSVFHKLFKNKLLIAILEASRTGKEAIPLWVGISMGAGIGLAIGLALFPFLFPQMIVPVEVVPTP